MLENAGLAIDVLDVVGMSWMLLVCACRGGRGRRGHELLVDLWSCIELERGAKY